MPILLHRSIRRFLRIYLYRNNFTRVSQFPKLNPIVSLSFPISSYRVLGDRSRSISQTKHTRSILNSSIKIVHSNNSREILETYIKLIIISNDYRESHKRVQHVIKNFHVPKSFSFLEKGKEKNLRGTSSNETSTLA